MVPTRPHSTHDFDQRDLCLFGQFYGGPLKGLIIMVYYYDAA